MPNSQCVVAITSFFSVAIDVSTLTANANELTAARKAQKRTCTYV